MPTKERYTYWISDKTFASRAVSLKESQFPELKKYCEENAKKRPTKNIYKEFEKRLMKEKIHKQFDNLCLVLSVCGFTFMGISGIIGVLLTVAATACGVCSIMDARKQKTKVKFKTIAGLVMALFIAFLGILSLFGM